MRKAALLVLLGTLTACQCPCVRQPAAAPALPTADPVSTEEAAPAEEAPAETLPAQPQPQPISQPAQAVQAAPVPAAPAVDAAPAEVPQPPAVTAAPDHAVFDGESLLDLSGRMLHPYAALAPDASAPQAAPWAYEQLKFGIYYSFIKAGTAYIRNRGLVNVQGRPAYLIQTSAFSAPVIDAVFKVRDLNQSWLDAADLYSRGYSQSVREGNYRRDEWVVLDETAGQYSGFVQKKGDPSPVSGPMDMRVLDVLSSLYYVRAQKLEVGQDIVFDIVNRAQQYPLVVKVLKKDTVKTPAGKFKCVVVEPQLRGESIFISKGKSLKVWLTDDEYKMPVQLKVDVFIGSVSAQLLEYKRLTP